MSETNCPAPAAHRHFGSSFRLRRFRLRGVTTALAFLLLAIHGRAPGQTLPPGLAPDERGPGRQSVPDREGVLTQFSTLDALLLGIYDGAFTVGQVKQQGDFGVGTYEGLDGEMIVLDGHFYHMRSSGVLSESSDDERVPFAVVTKFKADVQFSVKQVSLPQLGDLIDALLPSKNFFYAIKISGPFAAVSTRAIPKQFLPYPPLSQLIPIQSVFTYSNINGTAVGIRSPAFVSGINQVGHHFHFVSDDRKAGGHALSFTTGEVTVQIQVLRRNSLSLPDDEPFRKATLPAQ